MNKIDLSDPAARILPRILRQQARELPGSDFLIHGDGHVTFAQAEAQSGSLAAGLRALGVHEGDRVGMLLSGRPEAVLLAFAVNKLGAVWVPISTDYRGDWLADTVIRSRCKILVTESEYSSQVAEIRDRLGDSIIVVFGARGPDLADAVPGESLLTGDAIEGDCPSQSYGDTCAILWTSGTTGKSKGVLQSHNSWLRPIVLGVSPMYESQPSDIIYNVLPLFNSAAWVTSIFRALVEGIPCVLDGPFSVTHFWDRIRRYNATQSFTLGAMHMFLWNAPERPTDADNPLRVAQMVPMPADLQPRFEKRFGICVLGGGYGQSECLMICSSVGRDDSPPGSLGFPMEDTDVRLFDDDDNEVGLGEIGEVGIRSLQPHVVFNGYFDDAEATREAYRGENGEWYRTGDLVRRDETGAFFFVDRKKDALRYAGRNISTMEVEGVCRRHPAVADVAAFGIPSKELEAESELKVDIVLVKGAKATYEELASFINDNAPYYFVPRYMEFVDALPYTPTNKVQKFKLRDKAPHPGIWDRRESGYRVRR